MVQGNIHQICLKVAWSAVETTFSVHLAFFLESNKMKKLVQSAMEKSHFEPADNEPVAIYLDPLKSGPRTTFA